MKLVGVVLAGGLSRRFGSPKAFAKFKGKYFYEYALAALQDFCEEIIIVAREEFADQFPSGYEVITDDPRFIGKGPLVGIYSAMNHCPADRYMVLPCDMPFIQGNMMARLLQEEAADVVTFKTATYHHPLVSLWSASTKDKLATALAKNELRVVPFLHQLQTTWIHVNDQSPEIALAFKNVNRQDDLERGEES